MQLAAKGNAAFLNPVRYKDYTLHSHEMELLMGICSSAHTIERRLSRNRNNYHLTPIFVARAKNMTQLRITSNDINDMQTIKFVGQALELLAEPSVCFSLIILNFPFSYFILRQEKIKGTIS